MLNPYFCRLCAYLFVCAEYYYKPGNTFIDWRIFVYYEELYRYISAIDEDTYNTYLDNTNRFLHSETFQKSIYANYAHTIARVLTGTVIYNRN